jgi:hypothetical protein
MTASLTATNLEAFASKNPREPSRFVAYYLKSLETAEEAPTPTPMPRDASNPSSERASVRAGMKKRAPVKEKDRIAETPKPSRKPRKVSKPLPAVDAPGSEEDLEQAERRQTRTARRASLKAIRQGGSKRKEPPEDDDEYHPSSPAVKPKRHKKNASTELDRVAETSRKKAAHVTKDRITVSDLVQSAHVSDLTD